MPISALSDLRQTNLARGQGLWLALALILGAVQAALVITHDPWLDEWQALQIALQSPDLAALFANLRYEGHPPLWYLLLRGLSSLLPPTTILPAIQLPIALGIPAILWIKSPFSRLEKLLLCAGFATLIDYGAVARSLGLGVLLLLVAWSWRDRRASWIAVTLLPLTDFLFGLLSLVLILLAWREKRLWTPGLIVWLGCSLLAAWSVRPAPDMVPALALTSPLADGAMALARFGTVLLPLQLKGLVPSWNQIAPIALALPGGLAFFALGWLLLRGAPLYQRLFLGFCTFLMLFSVAVYPLPVRHLSLAGLLLVLFVWRRREDGAAPTPLFTAWLAACAACGLLAAGTLAVRPFDAAPQAARFIAAQKLTDRRWVTYPQSSAQGMSALSGIAFEGLGRGCAQSFVRWNHDAGITDFRRFEAAIAATAPGESFYLVTEFLLPARELRRPGDFRLLAHVPAGYDGQDFYLYRVRPDRPEALGAAPLCAPARRPLQAWR